MNTEASLIRPPLALIAGPTASGKSALAIALAERRNGIVINADSTQVYAELRILSARPSIDEEARVPHRLFGHVDGAEIYSAARWAAEARTAIDVAHSSGALPILVGGTGLYLQTLLNGIAPIPSIAPRIRDAVRALPVAEAYRQLRNHDPAAAARLAPGDTTRVARALEVVLSTGTLLGEWQRHKVGGIADRIHLQPFILLPDRDGLLDRCDRRLETMFAQGAVEEAAAVLARSDLAVNAPVRRAIGVAEIGAMLSGAISRDQALAAAQLSTRQYAKRQFTWFRNQPPAMWPRTTATETCVALTEFETTFL